MKAIYTQYRGATNHKPAQIVASDLDGNRARVAADSCGEGQYPYDAAHRAAAVALCDKMGWPGGETLIGGSLKQGMAWVFLPTAAAAPAPVALPRCQDQLENGPQVYTCQLTAGHDGAHRNHKRMWTS